MGTGGGSSGISNLVTQLEALFIELSEWFGWAIDWFKEMVLQWPDADHERLFDLAGAYERASLLYSEHYDEVQRYIADIQRWQGDGAGQVAQAALNGHLEETIFMIQATNAVREGVQSKALEIEMAIYMAIVNIVFVAVAIIQGLILFFTGIAPAAAAARAATGKFINSQLMNHLRRRMWEQTIKGGFQHFVKDGWRKGLTRAAIRGGSMFAVFTAGTRGGIMVVQDLEGHDPFAERGWFGRFGMEVFDSFITGAIGGPLTFGIPSRLLGAFTYGTGQTVDNLFKFGRDRLIDAAGWTETARELGLYSGMGRYNPETGQWEMVWNTSNEGMLNGLGPAAILGAVITDFSPYNRHGLMPELATSHVQLGAHDLFTGPSQLSTDGPTSWLRMTTHTVTEVPSAPHTGFAGGAHVDAGSRPPDATSHLTVGDGPVRTGTDPGGPGRVLTDPGPSVTRDAPPPDHASTVDAPALRDGPTHTGVDAAGRDGAGHTSTVEQRGPADGVADGPAVLADPHHAERGAGDQGSGEAAQRPGDRSGPGLGERIKERLLFWREWGEQYQRLYTDALVEHLGQHGDGGAGPASRRAPEISPQLIQRILDTPAESLGPYGRHLRSFVERHLTAVEDGVRRPIEGAALQSRLGELRGVRPPSRPEVGAAAADRVQEPAAAAAEAPAPGHRADGTPVEQRMPAQAEGTGEPHPTRSTAPHDPSAVDASRPEIDHRPGEGPDWAAASAQTADRVRADAERADHEHGRRLVGEVLDRVLGPGWDPHAPETARRVAELTQHALDANPRRLAGAPEALRVRAFFERTFSDGAGHPHSAAQIEARLTAEYGESGRPSVPPLARPDAPGPHDPRPIGPVQTVTRVTEEIPTATSGPRGRLDLRVQERLTQAFEPFPVQRYGGVDTPQARAATHEAARMLAERVHQVELGNLQRWLETGASPVESGPAPNTATAIMLSDGTIVAFTSLRAHTVRGPEVDLGGQSPETLRTGQASAEPLMHPAVERAYDTNPVRGDRYHPEGVCAEPGAVGAIAAAIEPQFRHQFLAREGASDADQLSAAQRARYQQEFDQRLREVLEGANVASHRTTGPDAGQEQFPCRSDDTLVHHFGMHADYVQRLADVAQVHPEHGIISLVPEGDPLRAHAEAIRATDPRSLVVVVHGEHTGDGFSLVVGGERLSHVELTRILEELRTRYPELAARDRIVLVSCESGVDVQARHTRNFGALLADRLGLPVLAPADVAWVSDRGAVAVSPARPVPGVAHPSSWTAFDPGGDRHAGVPDPFAGRDGAHWLPAERGPEVTAATDAAVAARTPDGVLDPAAIDHFTRTVPHIESTDAGHAALGELARRATGDSTAQLVGLRAGVGQGESGQPVFLVTDASGATIAIAKIFPEVADLARELSTLERFGAAEFTHFIVPEPLGIAVADTPAGPVGLYVMSLANGRSLYAMMEQLPPHGQPERAAALTELETAMRVAGTALAELHGRPDGSGGPVSPAFLGRHYDGARADLAALTTPAYRSMLERFGLDVDATVRLATDLIHRASRSPDGAGLMHGDAHPGNVFWHPRAGVTLIDLPSGHKSIAPDGHPIGTPEHDIANLTDNTRIFGRQLGLDEQEIARLQAAFHDGYRAGDGPELVQVRQRFFTARYSVLTMLDTASKLAGFDHAHRAPAEYDRLVGLLAAQIERVHQALGHTASPRGADRLHILAFDAVADGTSLTRLSEALGRHGDDVIIRVPGVASHALGDGVRVLGADRIPGITSDLGPLLRADGLPSDVDVIIGHGRTAGVADAHRTHTYDDPHPRVVQLLDAAPREGDRGHLEVIARADLVLAAEPDVARRTAQMLAEQGLRVPPIHDLPATGEGIHDAILAIGDVTRVDEAAWHRELSVRDVVLRRHGYPEPPTDGRLRVMTVVTEWGSRLGGVPTANRALSEALGAAGAVTYARVSVIDPSNPARVGPELWKDVVELHGVDQVWGVVDHKGRPDARAMILLLQNIPPYVDVVVGHSRFSGGAADWLAEHAYSDGAQYVHVLHTLPELQDGVRGDLEEGRRHAETERELVRRADVAAAVGPLLFQVLTRLGHEAMGDAAPPLHQIISDMPAVPGDPPSRPRDRDWYELTIRARADDPIIKGIDFAARVVAELRRDGLDVRLTVRGAIDDEVPTQAGHLATIMGLDPERVRAEVIDGLTVATVDGIVTVRERTTDPAVLLRDFSEADLALMPSLIEGFGLVASEAARAGIPVLVGEGTGAGLFFADPRYVPAELGQPAIVRDGVTVAELWRRLTAAEATGTPTDAAIRAMDDGRLIAWAAQVRSALADLDAHWQRAAELRRWLDEHFPAGSAARVLLDRLVALGDATAQPALVVRPRASSPDAGAAATGPDRAAHAPAPSTQS